MCILLVCHLLYTHVISISEKRRKIFTSVTKESFLHRLYGPWKNKTNQCSILTKYYAESISSELSLSVFYNLCSNL